MKRYSTFVLLSLIAAAVLPASEADRQGESNLRRGEGTSLLGTPGSPKAGGDLASAPGANRAHQEAIDQAVADAVHSFLGDYLSPRALADAEQPIARRVERRPDSFVPQVKVLSLGEENGFARAQVEARISFAALRGALLEVVPHRSILFVVDGTEGGEAVAQGTLTTRIAAELKKVASDLVTIDAGELEKLFEKRPELRRSLGGERSGAELGLRVLAELVCVGTVRVDAEETHLEDVFVGTAQADLRVIASKNAEVVAAVSVEFRDRIAARREEAVRRAGRAIRERIAEALARDVPRAKSRGLSISCDLGPIYTALLSGYRSSPFGEIRIRNGGKERSGPLTVKLAFDEGLLVEPFTVAVPALDPGSSVEIPVRGNLAAKLSSLGTDEISAKVALEEAGGQTLEEVRRAVLVHDPNVFSWREPAAIAAYIDPDDAAVKEFLRGVWRALPADEFPTPELSRAAAIYGALVSCGLRYRPDATVPGGALAARVVNDRVSYPGQLLAEGAGDCDDFAVLLAAAFESAGLESAVIVGKDHVIIAVETGLASADVAADIFGKEGIIAAGGRAWWPIETTALARAEPFLNAWRSAWPARQVLAAGEADFVAVRRAWDTWRPVARRDVPGARVAAAPAVPAAGLAERLRTEAGALRAYGLAQLGERAVALRAAGGKDADRLVGNLYASCGLLEEARVALRRALGNDGGHAVHASLGETLLMGPHNQRNLRASVAEFQAALKAVPPGDLAARADTLLRLALACRYAGDLEAEGKALGEAYAIDANLKVEYESLFDTATKGSPIGDRVRRFLLEGLK